MLRRFRHNGPPHLSVLHKISTSRLNQLHSFGIVLHGNFKPSNMHPRLFPERRLQDGSDEIDRFRDSLGRSKWKSYTVPFIVTNEEQMCPKDPTARSYSTSFGAFSHECICGFDSTHSKIIELQMTCKCAGHRR